jgi:hypothetical protein
MQNMFDVTSMVGFLALGLSLYSYLCKDYEQLMRIAALSAFVWALHFGLKEAWTPCAMGLLAVVRILGGLRVVTWAPLQRVRVTCGALALTLLVSAVTWQGAVSLPSLLATLLLTWASFNLKDLPLRVALLGAELFWLANGWAVGSVLAMTAASLSIALNLFVLARSRQLAVMA